MPSCTPAVVAVVVIVQQLARSIHNITGHDSQQDRAKQHKLQVCQHCGKQCTGCASPTRGWLGDWTYVDACEAMPLLHLCKPRGSVLDGLQE